MTEREFTREEPLGMTPFALGVTTLVGVGGLTVSGVEITPEVWPWAGGVGAVMVALGVHLFRRPHRLELDGDAVVVRGRFGRPRRWAQARLKAAPGLARVGLEVAAAAAALSLVALLADRCGPAQALLTAGYALAYGRWRLAPRAELTDGEATATIRLDGLPGAAEALAVRA